MKRHSRTRRSTVLTAVAAGLAVCAIGPSLASGQNPVQNVVNGLGLDGGGALPKLQQEEEPSYQPPLHGDNPHGQGTAATVDLLPNSELPYSGDPDGFEGDAPMESEEDAMNGEEVVIGRSRGEQNNPYHGHVTVLSVFGFELAGVDSNEDESEEFNPANQLILDFICSGSGGALCLGLVNAESQTSSTGSQNHFSAFSGSSGGIDSVRLGATFLESNGNIEEDSSCQRAHGDSRILHLGGGLDSRELSITVLGSSADSEACNNGTSSQTNDSHLFEINGQGVFPFCEGEQLFDLGIIALACNADDTNGVGEAVQQAPVPYGVREAFTFFLFPFFLHDNAFTRFVNGEEENGPLAFLKLTGAASESHAVAPPVPPGPTPAAVTQAPTVQGQQAQDGVGGRQQAGGPGEGPAGAEAQPGGEGLPFTGVDVLLVILMGLGLLGAGLAIAGASRSKQVI